MPRKNVSPTEYLQIVNSPTLGDSFVPLKKALAVGNSSRLRRECLKLCVSLGDIHMCSIQAQQYSLPIHL